jgi:hypothetical protein
MARAHYIWIGKPPTGEHGGQDTVGPLIMQKRMPEQPVTFWCLASQKKHYEKIYKDTNIEVLAIEDAIPLPQDQEVLDFIHLCLERAQFLEGELAEVEKHLTEASDNLDELIEQKKQLKKDIAREYISIKDVMIYYLQTKHLLSDNHPERCQYYLDTNITLSPDNAKSRLQEVSEFSAPYDQDCFDPWLMITTLDEQARARIRFDTMFEQHSKEVYFRLGLGSPKGRGITTHSSFSRLLLGASYVDNCRDAVKLQMHKRAGDHRYLDIGLQKRYMNTHKPNLSMDSTHIVISIATGHSSLDELEHFLKTSNFNPNDSITTEYYDAKLGCVPIHTNIFFLLCETDTDKSGELSLLIDAMDDLSLLFFNDESTGYDWPPALGFCDRQIKGTCINEFTVLLQKCFERHPMLETLCYEYVQQLLPSLEIKTIHDLIDAIQVHDVAYTALLYTIKDIIPEKAKRSLPIESFEQLEAMLVEKKELQKMRFFKQHEKEKPIAIQGEAGSSPSSEVAAEVYLNSPSKRN